VYGLISQAVVERAREFGVRLALGAGRSHIALLVLRSALVVVACGAPIGLGLAAVLAQVVRAQLYGVTPGDPAAYVAASAALLAVVMGAGIVPAWMAARTDPLGVLKTE
jgi:ABC-type antimicrobial peptide transport system permease subunit